MRYTNSRSFRYWLRLFTLEHFLESRKPMIDVFPCSYRAGNLKSDSIWDLLLLLKCSVDSQFIWIILIVEMATKSICYPDSELSGNFRKVSGFFKQFPFIKGTIDCFIECQTRYLTWEGGIACLAGLFTFLCNFLSPCFMAMLDDLIED